eukprot:c23386_g1_i1 orf=201-1106(-)
MRSPWLLGTRDSLLREPPQQQISICAAFSSCVPSWHVYKEKGSAVLFVCRSPFGEAEALDCSFRASNSICLHRGEKLFSGRKVSEKLVALSSTGVASTESAYEEWEAADEYDKELAQYRGLVLDVSYRPINVVCWRRALCLEILEKADVLEYYDEVINSPSKPFAIPAVLRINDYCHTPVHNKVKLSLNRKNLFLRDKFRCQYCKAQENLTVDHVIPVSRGGEWTWENLVTACSKCNARKSDKTLEESRMQLIKVPKEPRAIDGIDLPSNYAAFRRMQNSKSLPSEWAGYLPKRFQPMDSF